MGFFIGHEVRENTSTIDLPETNPVKPVVPRAQQGWQCPKCGRVLAPWVASCTCSMYQSPWQKPTITWSESPKTY